MDQVNLLAWTGRTEAATGSISRLDAHRIAAVLGAPSDQITVGTPMPALWHWCAFPPTVTAAELGADGHPHLGGFMPPVRLDRRMWAGGALRFHAPLCVGDQISRQSTIRSATEKEGRMVFVTVDHRICGPRGLAVEERQDIVYLPMPDRYDPPKKRAMPDQPTRQYRMDMTETLLFRYSAVTLNAHRIHYDLNYARTVEQYPGLVVHGPLQATLLMQEAVALRGSCPTEFHFRAVHPMFAGEPMDLVTVEEEDGSAQLSTGQSGHRGMDATAIWEATV